MRVRTGLLIVLGLIVLSGLGFWLVRSRNPAPPATIAVAPPPPPAAAPPPEPPPAAPPADATAPNANTGTPDNAGPAAGSTGDQGLPPLPEVKVAEHPIHAVPEDKTPEPNHSGQPTAGQSEEVRLGAHALAPPAPPHQFSGTATATGAVELKVDTTTISLFGIKPPAERDRCADAGGDCLAVAKRALAARIGNSGKVSCRIPNPHPGTVTYAICLDPTGFDLSGFLIAQGLALADTGQSYDYVGAESIARNLKRGLWKFRS
jgi:endonuclease YncB( thermonuclease family)